MNHGAKALVLLVALGVVGCGDDDEPGPTNKSDSGSQGWTASVGDDGTFVQTFDNQSWHVRQIADVDLHAVTCVGTTGGWAVGANGFVAHTPDGGATWERQNAGTSATLRAVHFVHDHSTSTERVVGVAAGDDGALAVTVDHGSSWKLASATSATLRGVTGIINAELLVAVGDGGVVLRSEDSGATWQSSILDQAPDLTAVDADPHGQLVVTVDTSGGIWASHDRATSFVLERRAAAPLRSVVVAPDGKGALAVGDSGTALGRSAGGTWQALGVGSDKNLAAALITHAGDRAYAAGEGGTLLSANGLAGGWTLQRIATQVSLRGIEDLDPH